MEKIGYSIVKVADGSEWFYGNLPLSPPPPGKPKGRLATFDNIGQEVEGYRCVERWKVARPSVHHVPGQQTVNFDGTKVIVDPNWTALPLDDVKTRLKDRLNDDAEQKRLKYITAGDGKSLSYREGYEEAVEILADTDAALALVSQPSTDPAFANACEEAYPVSYPDIGKGGTSSIVELAALVASKYEAFQKIENQIKKTVNAAKAAIDAAGDVAAAQAAYDAAAWTV